MYVVRSYLIHLESFHEHISIVSVYHFSLLRVFGRGCVVVVDCLWFSQIALPLKGFLTLIYFVGIWIHHCLNLLQTGHLIRSTTHLMISSLRMNI